MRRRFSTALRVGALNPCTANHIKLSVLGRNHHINPTFWGFPGGSAVKNPPAIAGDMGSIPGPGRFHTLQSN